MEKLDVVQAARLEQADLVRKRSEFEETIEGIDRRLAELETFIRVAGTIVAVSSASLTLTPIPPLVLSAPNGEGSKPATFKDRVITFTEELLTHQKWMKTKEIVARLEASGVTINTSSNKVVRVSSILVKEKEKFFSNRKRGWTLRQVRIDAPKVKGPNARTFSPLGTTSRGGQPTLAAQPSD